MEKLVVLDCFGQRIDSFLAEKLDLSRSKIQKLVKEGKILVNDQVVSNSYMVRENDVVLVDDELDYDIHVLPQDIPLDIVYEDQDLIVLNKPSGMVVHPAPGHYEGTLVNALLYRYGELTSDSFRPGIVHRLDKDTSGLMLVAKNDSMLEKLSSMIASKEVVRKYLAIVDGVIPHEVGEIDAPIGRDPHNRQKMAVTDVNGKDAITYFKVLEKFQNHTLVECVLETGRTHQIRVHMAYIGYPVMNDPLYGRGKATSFGQMLHSYSLTFIHPKTGEEMHFEVEAPKEFQEEIKKLRGVEI